MGWIAGVATKIPAMLEPDDVTEDTPTLFEVIGYEPEIERVPIAWEVEEAVGWSGEWITFPSNTGVPEYERMHKRNGKTVHATEEEALREAAEMLRAEYEKKGGQK